MPSAYFDTKGKVCSNCGDYKEWIDKDGNPNFYFSDQANRHSARCRPCTLLILRAANRRKSGDGAFLAIPLHLLPQLFKPVCRKHDPKWEMLSYRGARICSICHTRSIIKANRKRRRRARAKKAKANGELPLPIPSKIKGNKQRRGSKTPSRRIIDCGHPEEDRYLSIAENRTRCRSCRREANARDYKRDGSARAGMRLNLWRKE